MSPSKLTGICCKLQDNTGLLVNHHCSPAILGAEMEVEWDRQGLCIQLLKYLSGGYLKCSGALLLATFEGLNQGLKG